MIVLAIETTTDRLSVAGLGGSAVRRTLNSGLRTPDSGLSSAIVAERMFDGARMHAAKLFPLVDEVLNELGVTIEQVDALAIADGPGSFTGLRVGVAAAKALARACPRLSVWTASTLLVRAAAARAPRHARVMVVTSALRGELFAASFRLDLPNTVETLSPPALATPESLSRETPDLLVADAPDKLVDRLADQFAVPLVRGPLARPSAAALATLVGVPGGSELIGNLDDWEPTYGRPAEAQARWESAHGRSLPDSSRGPR